MADSTTIPGSHDSQDGHTPRLLIEPAYRDPATGALYVHQDLAQVLSPYEEESHIAPTKENVKLGDIDSWARYISRYGTADYTFATWTRLGLTGILDYHTADDPGRASWHVLYRFRHTENLIRWEVALGNTQVSHRDLVELLEDSAADILHPPQAEVMDILRTLRVTTASRADTEIRSDGTTSITWHSDAQVRGSQSGETAMPEFIHLSVPAIEGYTDEDGNTATISFAVRVRAQVDKDGHIAFRLSCPDLETRIDELSASIAGRAQTLLNGLGMQDVELLRAA